MITKEEKDIIISRLAENEEIRALYDVFIIKSISFKDWVKNMAEAVLNPKPRPDADVILAKIMKETEK